MAFGKKKDKKNKNIEPVAKTVALDKNPLYPPKQESEMKEIGIAVATVVVSIALVFVIVKNFSRMYTTDYYVTEETVVMEEVQEPEDTEISAEEAETEQEEVVEEVSPMERDYIIEGSDSRYISTSELEGLTAQELKYARNEIYARHGRLFKDTALQNYFNSKTWYQGTISPDSFSENMLNEYERANTQTIASFEKAKGYR